MGKAVLTSIKPKWCELIASGEKTVEVRKTKPKVETPFKVYIYETKSLYKPMGCNHFFEGRGKVIGEFVCDKIECFTTDYRADWAQTKRISEQSCVCILDLSEYEAQSNCLYDWHISSLVIYDKPKELGEFRLYDCRVEFENGYPIPTHTIKRPPQSWCYVEECEHNG